MEETQVLVEYNKNFLISNCANIKTIVIAFLMRGINHNFIMNHQWELTVNNIHNSLN